MTESEAIAQALTREQIHEQGAIRHGRDWLNANEVAVQVLWGSKLRVDDPKVKHTIPLILLRVLDRLRLTNGEQWNGQRQCWVQKSTNGSPAEKENQ